MAASTALLLMCTKSLQAQVLFAAPALPLDTSTTRQGRASFRVSCFESTINFQREGSPERLPINPDIDSLLACFTDSIFKGSNAVKHSVGNPTHQLQFIPAIPPLRLVSWQEYRVTSKFGWRTHPIGGNTNHHNGLDIAQPTGTPVYATAFGVVKWVKREMDGLGLAVCIEHPTGYESIYGHLSTHAVRERDVVQRGALVGQVGSTGHSTGPHLHYAILFQGKPVDPERYCFLWIKLARAELTQIQQHRLDGPGFIPKRTKGTIKRD